jgi:hypothetical protein
MYNASPYLSELYLLLIHYMSKDVPEKFTVNVIPLDQYYWNHLSGRF